MFDAGADLKWAHFKSAPAERLALRLLKTLPTSETRGQIAVDLIVLNPFETPRPSPQALKFSL